jgi:hypothetical protein
MSIRKRYEEAKFLIEAGQSEAALIILLVAIAACSVKEAEKKGWKKGKPIDPSKGRNSPKFGDAYFFKQYLNDPVRANVIGSNIVEGFAETLYKELRCNLIHEAVIFRSGEGFSDDPGNFSFVGDGTFTFGTGLLHSLMRAIRLDENIRDQFEDIKHPLEAKPMIFDMGGVDTVISDFNETVVAALGDESWINQVSDLRKDVLLALVRHIGPKTIGSDTYESLRSLIGGHRDELLYFSGNAINGGGISGLSKTHPPIFNYDNGLTKEGWRLLQQICHHATEI